MTSSAIRRSSSWLVRFGRLGYAAKGTVYIVMGVLATKAALGVGQTTDTRGALRAIGEAPFGKLALWIILIGLFGYTAWRIVSAATDAERRGDEPTSIALRIGEAFRGLVYGVLAYWTLRYVTVGTRETDNQAESVTRQILSVPTGRWIVIAAGLGVIAYAVYQVYRAASGKFLKRLDLASAGHDTAKWLTRMGRFGIVARAVVFGVIGVLLVRAGWTFDASEAGGIRQSLNALAAQPGTIVFTSVAIGLIAFGILELATARYRVMRAA